MNSNSFPAASTGAAVPSHDIHSSLKACVDSPAWRLIHALNTLVSADGNTPAIPGFADKARPLSPTEKQMIAVAAKRMDEKLALQAYGVKHWINDAAGRSRSKC